MNWNNWKRSLFKSVIVLLLFSWCVSAPLYAQKKADRYYSSGAYARAITLYEKRLRHKADPKAMYNVADCYRLTRQYDKAEYWYAKAIASGAITDPVVHFRYGMVLKSNNKPELAREQFDKYIAAAPGNQSGIIQINSIKELRNWLSQKPIYTVKPLNGINSEYSDFAPVYKNNTVYFTSNRGDRDLLNGDNDGATNQAYHALYSCDIKNSAEDSVAFGKVGKLSRHINKDFHNGPASVSSDGKMLVFTRSDAFVRSANSKKINRLRLFICTQKGNAGWSAPEPFQYNSGAYSVAHPALSADGQVLFFTSDMPGGQGGRDIWMCRKEGSGWSAPVNLGSEVNTAGNEEFPYVRKDGVLFFASDGHPGFGGLDIYSATQLENKWTEVTNQGAPLNGPTDDFAIAFNENNTGGLFSSDRSGGKGSDDIYAFTVANKFIRIAGTVLTSKDPNDVLADSKVSLLTEDGQVVKITRTDSKGNFQFNNLPSDKQYLVALDENDPQLKDRKKFYYADEKHTLLRVTYNQEPGGKYTFVNMPAEGTAPQLVAEDELLTIAGNLVSAGNPPQPLSNILVNLTDDKGNVVQTTTTNAFGAFTFSRLPPDKTYLVAMADNNELKLSASSRIIITNKSGKELMSTTPDANGRFAFKILSSDRTTLQEMTVTDPELRLDLRGTLVSGDGNNTILSNTKLNIVDESGNTVQTVTTDAAGRFNFVNLPADKTYLVLVDDAGADPKLMTFGRLYIKDDKGKVVRILNIGRSGKYELRVLPSDRNIMSFVYVEDPWLQVLQMKEKAKNDSLLIIENIYYDYADWKILPAAEITLEKVVRVMNLDQKITIEISAHTDSRAKEDFNLNLSKKRAKSVVDYLVKRGVPASRLTSVGLGESRLLNKCADGVECTEEEHGKNRRTEFKINRAK